MCGGQGSMLGIFLDCSPPPNIAFILLLRIQPQVLKFAQLTLRSHDLSPRHDLALCCHLLVCDNFSLSRQASTSDSPMSHFLF